MVDLFTDINEEKSEKYSFENESEKSVLEIKEETEPWLLFNENKLNMLSPKNTDKIIPNSSGIFFTNQEDLFNNQNKEKDFFNESIITNTIITESSNSLNYENENENQNNEYEENKNIVNKKLNINFSQDSDNYCQKTVNKYIQDSVVNTLSLIHI